VEGIRANAYRRFAGLLTNGSPVLNLMISNDAIYWTLVVPDIVIGGSAEPWLISRGENAIASRALNYLLGPRLFRCFTDLGIDTFGRLDTTAQRDDLRRRGGET
jgi:hypothetical protein